MNLLNVTKSAKYLGVSESSMYRYAENNEIRTYIKNGKFHFRKCDLDLIKKFPVKEAKKRLKKILTAKINNQKVES